MPDTSESAIDQLVSEVAGMRAELQRLVPHLQVALRRAEQENSDRLQLLERQAREHSSWPLAIKIHRLREHLSRTGVDESTASSVCDEIDQILEGFGYRTFGKAGEFFNPDRHQVIENEAAGLDSARHAVEKVHARGLMWAQSIIFTARVSVNVGVFDASKLEGIDDSDE
jgi:molecular chaperone GrpE (heat shock protein)